jgi:hypothetical protein
MADDRDRRRPSFLDQMGDKVRELMEDLVEAVQQLVNPPPTPVPIRSGRR